MRNPALLSLSSSEPSPSALSDSGSLWLTLTEYNLSRSTLMEDSILMSVLEGLGVGGSVCV